MGHVPKLSDTLSGLFDNFLSNPTRFEYGKSGQTRHFELIVWLESQPWDIDRDSQEMNIWHLLRWQTLIPTLTLILTLPWTKSQIITLALTLCRWRYHHKSNCHQANVDHPENITFLWTAKRVIFSPNDYILKSEYIWKYCHEEKYKSLGTTKTYFLWPCIIKPTKSRLA